MKYYLITNWHARRLPRWKRILDRIRSSAEYWKIIDFLKGPDKKVDGARRYAEKNVAYYKATNGRGCKNCERRDDF